MLVNNLNSGTSLSSNCEQDLSKPLVNDVHELLLEYNNFPELVTTNSIQENEQSPDEAIFNPDDLIIFDPQDVMESDRDELLFFNPHELNIFDANEMFTFEPEVPKEQLSLIDKQAIFRMCSSVCGGLVERTDCLKCIDALETTSDSVCKNPSPAFVNIFETMYCYATQIVPDLCSEKSLKVKLFNQLAKETFDDIGCSNHKSVIEKNMRDSAVCFAIKEFVNNINNLLSGKITILPPGSNNIQNSALEFRNKGKSNKKYKGTDDTKPSDNFNF